MKVAVNRCYGGFDLSPKAVKMLMNRKGLNCFMYKQTKYKFDSGKEEFTRIDETSEECGLGTYYAKNDLGDKTDNITKDSYWYYGDIDRTDEDLISVIEELGNDASGRFGSIEVVEIPDDIEWEIDNYDGIETIHECHRSW